MLTNIWYALCIAFLFCVYVEAATPVKFELVDHNGSKFIFASDDSAEIQKIRNILSGKETKHVKFFGIIEKKKATYNPNWSFSVRANSVYHQSSAFSMCNANIKTVESRLNEACGSFLPNCYWCPSTAKVTREIP